KPAPKARTGLAAAGPQAGGRFRRQAPALGGRQRRLAALRGLDRLVRHWLCSPMPAQPPQSSPGVAFLQGPLGGWCPGSILRKVAEHSGPSQRLLEGFPPAILYPRRLGLKRHDLVPTAKRFRRVPRTTRGM